MTTVPTNTPEKWYTELSVLGSPHCKLDFEQSTSEKWVRVILSYTPPILQEVALDHYEEGPRHYSLKSLKLNSPAILREHPRIAAEVIYVAEFGYLVFRETRKHEVLKKVYFGFSRQNLIKTPEIIKTEIEGVLAAIEQETDLIRQDNLARGEIVSSLSSSAILEEGERVKNASGELNSGFKENDPPEWWGRIALFSDDFISAVHIFPWMPTEIAVMQF
jgi:hypothetical protein